MGVVLRDQKRVFLASVAIGIAYGGLARLVFGLDQLKDVFGVMTFSFIFLVPFGLGVATVLVGERRVRWEWQPNRRLAFSIAADPASIPQTTLDEHVTVGGPFFDVLRGEYEIEPVAPGRVVLHLASTHRLSTHFNLYSGIWTDLVMRDVQEYILEILKRRCEAGR